MPEKTEAQKKAQKKYMEKFMVAQVRMEREKYVRIQAHAETQGESVNGFINRAIDHQISQDCDRAPSEARRSPLGAEMVSIPSEAYKCAVAASEAAGEELPDFVARAVTIQAEWDKRLRELGGAHGN